MIGGLSKDDELRVIWSKFDDEERRQKFRSAEQVGLLTSGNDVLGAWEEELSLHDLSDDEGPW